MSVFRPEFTVSGGSARAPVQIPVGKYPFPACGYPQRRTLEKQTAGHQARPR